MYLPSGTRYATSYGPPPPGARRQREPSEIFSLNFWLERGSLRPLSFLRFPPRPPPRRAVPCGRPPPAPPSPEVDHPPGTRWTRAPSPTSQRATDHRPTGKAVWRFSLTLASLVLPCVSCRVLVSCWVFLAPDVACRSLRGHNARAPSFSVSHGGTRFSRRLACASFWNGQEHTDAVASAVLRSIQHIRSCGTSRLAHILALVAPHDFAVYAISFELEIPPGPGARVKHATDAKLESLVSDRPLVVFRTACCRR